MMKTWRMMFFSLLFTIFGVQSLHAAYSIDEIVLYPSCAVIHASYTAFIGDSGVIDIGYVPESVLKDSISIQVEPPFQLVEMYVDEVKDDSDRSMLKAEIDDLKLELSVLNSQKRFIESLLAVNGSNAVISKELPSLDRVLELSDGLGKKLISIMKRVDAVKYELKKKENSLKEWEYANKWKISARVYGPKGREIEVRISYRDVRSGWRPIYIAHLMKDRVDFIFNALLYQKSGIDWNGVNIKLTTAKPRDRVIPPQPRPFFIRPIEPIGILRKNMAVLPDEETMKGNERIEKPLAIYRESEASASYSLSKPVTLASGQDTVIQVNKWSSNATIKRICFAEGDEAVYMVAHVKSFPTILPSGKIQLFQNDIRVGETYFNAKAPLDLYFGKDQTLKVKRTLTKRYLDKKFGGKIEVTLEYETTIFNIGGSQKVIEVVERIPVSQDERIQVTFKGAEPYTKPDPEKGFLKWLLTVPSKDSAQVQYSFSVKYPEEFHLNHQF